MKRCPHCMQTMVGSNCPYCGKSTAVEVKSHMLPIGTVLKERYEIGAPLGQGGFGITYVAWDRKTQQRVAIKEYFPNRCTSLARTQKVTVCALNGYEQVYANGMKSFAHEGQMLAQVSHIPGVVHVFDGFNANNTSYIVMEFVEGETLKKIIGEKGRMSTEELTVLFTPLLKDLEQIHAMNITHRDISPDNIIRMPNGNLKLLDFGSARQIEDGKSVSLTLKPGFSPPEQYTTKGQGSFTDVYALTATMYYCLTATVPLSSPARLEGEELPAPRQLGANLTGEQEAVLLWGMMTQPKDRPANMSIFARRFYEMFPLPEPEPEPIPEPIPKPIPDPDPKTIPGTVPEPKPYTKPDPKPDPKPDKKKVSTVVKITAALAAVVVLIVVLINLPTWLQDMNPVFQMTTEDGAVLELDRNSKTATLLDVGDVASSSSGDTLTLVDEVEASRYGRVDGTYQVTKIAKGACKDLSGVNRVILPDSVKEIEDGAFDNCADLDFLHVSSQVTMDSGAFVNCDCPVLWLKSSNISTPAGFTSYFNGEITDCGKLIDIACDEQGILYGYTDEQYSIVLDIPENLEELTLKDTANYTLISMKEDALDGLNMPKISVECEYFMYPMELCKKAEWSYGNSPSEGWNLAHSWHLSVSQAITFQNIDYMLETSDGFVIASYEILLEAAQSDSDKPLSTFDWGEVLTKYSLDWNNAQSIYRRCDLADAYTEAEGIQEDMVKEVWTANKEGTPYTHIAFVFVVNDDALSMLYVLYN